jgi:DNA-3-methyladenine glycosylase I
MTDLIRCGWVNLGEPLYMQYHDEEWGTPCHDDQKL